MSDETTDQDPDDPAQIPTTVAMRTRLKEEGHKGQTYTQILDQVLEERDRLRNEVDHLHQEIDDLRQQIADLEEIIEQEGLHP